MKKDTVVGIAVLLLLIVSSFIVLARKMDKIDLRVDGLD